MKKSIGKIRLDYLNTFYYLVKYKNFSETARILNKTQGTISLHIKELEKAFGNNESKQLLIDRTSKRFRLTAEGKLLYETVEKVLALTKTVSDEIEASLGIKEKQIDIFSSSIPGEYILPEFILKYKQKFRDINVEVHISNSQDALAHLNDSSSKFCAVGGLFGELNEELDMKPIGSDKIVIIARENHPIFVDLKNPLENRSQDYVIGELMKYPWIFRESGSATLDWFMNQFPQARNFQFGLKFHNNSSILHALENSDALTALSSFVLSATVNDRTLKVVKHKSLPVIKRNLHIIKYKSAKLQNYEQKFWDLF